MPLFIAGSPRLIRLQILLHAYSLLVKPRTDKITGQCTQRAHRHESHRTAYPFSQSHIIFIFIWKTLTMEDEYKDA